MSVNNPQGANFPNESVTSVNFTSTGADVGFGFNAYLIRMRNRASKSVYVTLTSTTNGTTGGHEVGSSEDVMFNFRGAVCGGLSFVATSSGGTLTIGAWG